MRMPVGQVKGAVEEQAIFNHFETHEYQEVLFGRSCGKKGRIHPIATKLHKR